MAINRAGQSTALAAGFVMFFCSVAGAQSPDEQFKALDAASDTTAASWLQLARSARAEGETKLATEALERASAGSSPVVIAVERARIAVTAGNPAAAVDALQAASDGGFNGVRALRQDPVLSGLAGDPEYEALLTGMEEGAFPCQHDEAFRAFDFWLGEWDVQTASGQQAGRNSVRSIESGCALTENWSDIYGGTGSSINYLDRRTGKWVQVWNSEAGAQIFLEGGMTDAGMNLVGEIHYIGNGTTAALRGLWTPLEDGRVRQFFEQSTDGGETWAPWFEGFYSRRAADSEVTD